MIDRHPGPSPAVDAVASKLRRDKLAGPPGTNRRTR